MTSVSSTTGKRKSSNNHDDINHINKNKTSKNCNHVEHTIDPVLFEPFEYINQIPGKDVRGKLINCFAKWLPLPNDTLEAIKDIVASLHNASLLVDDIEDNSKLRRGVPVAHTIYGVASTINCANYVYFQALDKCHKLDNPKCIRIFIEELLNLHRGQGHDIYWRDQCECPTEEQYKGMVLDKTGGLFRLAVALMQCFSEATTDFNPLLNLLGYYFQVRDDYLNVSNDAYMQTKSYCEDLTEGKFSFPIIHAIRSFPEDHRLINILKQKSENYDLKKYAVSYMYLCGSMDYTRETLRTLYTGLVAEIKRLGGHPELEGLMHYLDLELDRENKNNDSDNSDASDNSDTSSSTDKNFVINTGLGTPLHSSDSNNNFQKEKKGTSTSSKVVIPSTITTRTSTATAPNPNMNTMVTSTDTSNKKSKSNYLRVATL